MASNVIAPLKALTAPTAATLAAQINVNNVMLDSKSMVQSAIEDAVELQQKLVLIQRATDPGDPNYAALGTIIGNL